jgi:tRNA-splicing ligase RtcB
VQLEEGVIDWDAEREKMGAIELRGGAADEAPGAYKRLSEVLEAQGPTIQVLRTLRPIGVAMAPGHVASDD